MSCAARWAFSMLCSNENSGVCTPITTRPWSLYFSSHARTYGSVRSQLMQVYVQKLTTTTFPRRSLGSSCAELSQSVAPRSEGKCPSTGSSPLRPINPLISPSEVVDVEDGVREGLGRLLRQVMADTALDRPMLVLPGELRRVGARVRMG